MNRLNHIKRTHLRWTPLLFAGVLATGCAQGESAELGDDLGGDKADGFVFERSLDPLPIALDGSPMAGQYDPDRYAAYRFEVDDATKIIASVEYSWRVWAASAGQCIFTPECGPQSRLLLFRRDPSASLDDSPEKAWDLVYQQTSADFEDLEYDVLAPGEFMLLAIAEKETVGLFKDRIEYEVSVSDVGPGAGDDRLKAREPGHAEFIVVTDDGSYAKGLRVGLGTAEGFVDQQGIVDLRGVEPGYQIVKLGPDGTGDPLDGGVTYFVHGNGAILSGTLVVSGADYDAWVAADIDICEEEGWYGDGEICDDCPEPDPDCEIKELP